MAPRRREPIFPPGETRTSIRLPDGWAERIFALAAATHRSFHGEMLWLIELGIRAEAEIVRRPEAGNEALPASGVSGTVTGLLA